MEKREAPEGHRRLDSLRTGPSFSCFNLAPRDSSYGRSIAAHAPESSIHQPRRSFFAISSTRAVASLYTHP